MTRPSTTTASPGEAMVERARMALAELGYPADVIYLARDGIWRWHGSRVPAEVMWRARSTAGMVQCRACFLHVTALHNAGYAVTHQDLPCESVAPFTEDCGVER